jgi:hypothetical protein
MTNDAAYAYDFPEVARRLALSERSVRNLANRGDLPTIEVLPGKRRVTHTALLAYLADRENAARGRGVGRRLTALAPRRNPTEAVRAIGRPIG